MLAARVLHVRRFGLNTPGHQLATTTTPCFPRVDQFARLQYLYHCCSSDPMTSFLLRRHDCDRSNSPSVYLHGIHLFEAANGSAQASCQLL
jgi:hypothetical protein